jgi:hypothetical protein
MCSAAMVKPPTAELRACAAMRRRRKSTSNVLAVMRSSTAAPTCWCGTE